MSHFIIKSLSMYQALQVNSFAPSNNPMRKVPLFSCYISDEHRDDLSRVPKASKWRSQDSNLIQLQSLSLIQLQSLSFNHYAILRQPLTWFLIYTTYSQLYEHVASGINFPEFVGVHVSSVWLKNRKALSVQIFLLQIEIWS